VLTFSSRTRGFTLIELMIGLAILSLLMMLGFPAFMTMLQNQKLRAGAESILNGLQNARAEAVKRNVQVQFMLTNDDVISANVSAALPNTAGQNWVVRASSGGFYEFVESKYGTTTVTVAGSNPTGTFNGTVTFTGLGTTTLNSSAALQVANLAGGACVAGGGPMRCLNVVVSPGGQVKMCDPSIAAAGDTRKC
jgi:type IV fimbrial biogenesis protein FimT